MSTIPSAEWQNPSCGACFRETRCEGSGEFICEDCSLVFRGWDLVGSFLNEEDVRCSSRCNNLWHAPHRVEFGLAWECYPCALPRGHASMHWNPCGPKDES